MKRRYLDCSWGQLHYLEDGPSDGPAVVLLHQVPSSALMWSALLPELASRGYHAIAMDMPGYGLTDPLVPEPRAVSLEDYAGAISEAMDLLGIPEAYVVGHHTGAGVSLVLAATPGRVKAAALWGIPVLEADHAEELAAEPPPDYSDPLAVVTEWYEGRSQYTYEPWTSTVMPRSLLEMLMCGIHRPDGHVACGRVESWEKVLGSVTAPVLAMTGTLEMLDAETRRAAELYPDIYTLGAFEGRGMDAADEDPAGVADAVDAFFQSKG